LVDLKLFENQKMALPKKYLTLFIVLLLSNLTLVAQEPTLKASTSKNKLGLNQRVRVEFTIDKQGGDDFTPPDFSNFRLISGPGQSISQSYINGKVSFSQSYTYILQPRKKGELYIKAASIQFEGKTLKSKPIKVIVVDEVDMPKDPNDPDYIAQQNVHLVAEISKERPFVGEGVYVEYKLYVSQNISVHDFQITESPEYNGFWNQDIKINGLPVKHGKYNGQMYRYVVLKKALLIPTKSGNLTIEPMKMDVVIGVPTGRADFFGNPINRNVNRTFSSAKKTVAVKSLPTLGKPDNYNGAVGDFNFSVTTNRDLLKANETSEITLKVTGEGNLKLFELPEIEAPSQLEVYSPEQKENVRVNTKGLKGSVTKSYTVVPEYKGKYKIPQVAFSYFNPREKKYHTLTSEDIFVDVLEGKELITNSDAKQTTKQTVVSTGANFRFIQSSSKFETINQPTFLGSKLYFILLLLPLAVIPIVILLNKRVEARNSDLVGVKKRRADKLAKKFLTKAKKELNNKENFYLALEKALHNYLKAKLLIETSEIAKDKIAEILLGRGANQETVTQFISVLKSCELARYTPVTEVAIQEDYEKAKKAITQIDKQI